MQQRHVLETLEDLGVHLLEPDTPRDQDFAHVLGMFSTFCLEDNAQATLLTLEHYMDKDNESVGELQGGSDASSIYRVSIPMEDTDHKKGGGAVAELFQAFSAAYPQHASVLTTSRLRQYMLQMCNDPRRQDDLATYRQIGNFMFILSFGPVQGQVRHIDHMDPNLQVCLYMSEDCPATIVYELQEPTTSPSITNCQELVDHWDDQQPVPQLVRQLLTDLSNVVLAEVPHVQYFGFWKSLDEFLANFGKLYQPVAQRLAIDKCTPGTTLVAKGNQVHAGPPSTVPRMFAFCIGIPNDDDGDNNNYNHDTTPATSVNNTNKNETKKAISAMGGGEIEDQNGEIQYNPVLLHVDLCCILFTCLDFGEEYEAEDPAAILAAKRYLLGMLPDMIREFPAETYRRLLGDDRAALRSWLGDLVAAVSADDSDSIQRLLEQAATSTTTTTTILMSPNVAEGTKLRRKLDKASQKKKKKKNNKKTNHTQDVDP